MSDIDSRLSAGLVSVFRPLASLLVRTGVNIRPVIELLKRCYVDAALNEHGSGEKRASISRASRMTGLTRAEVRRLAKQEGVATMPGTILGDHVAAVLAMWFNDSRFHDESGAATILPMTGPDASFENLVRTSSGSDDYQGALNELEGRGCVRMTSDGEVELMSRADVVFDNLPIILAHAIGTLAYTIHSNWGKEEEERLAQKTAFVASVEAEKLLSLRRMCNERVSRFIEETDDLLMPHQLLPEHADDPAEVTRTHRIGVGAYYFEIEAPD